MRFKYGNLFDEWELKAASAIVRDFLENWPCLRKYDRDYLFSGCLIHWHKSRGTYKEGRGSSQKTYMTRVLRNHLTSLVRREVAEKRKMDYLPDSLDRSIDPDDPDMTLLDQASYELHEPSEVDLAFDLERSLRKLEPRQIEICRLLKQGRSITAIAGSLGLSRDTIYEEEMRIREIFHKDGLRKYL